MAVRLVPGQRRDTSRPVEVTAQVQVSGQHKTPRGLVAFRTDAVFRADDHDIAIGNATARIVDPVIYDRFRRGGPTGAHYGRPVYAVPADQVGHTSSWNVVVGHPDGPGRWPLLVDTSNPILFDHPLDHVPGVLLIEVVRQALRLELQDPRLDFEDFDAQFLGLLGLII